MASWPTLLRGSRVAFRKAFYLRPTGPYNFDLSYSFYRRSRFETVDRFADWFFVRPFLFEDIPVLITVLYGNGGLVDTLKVAWQSPVAISHTARLRRRLIEMFYLDFDLDEFYGHALGPVLRRLTRRFAGFRPILTPNVFEAAAWAIIGQQVNLQFAYRLKTRLVQTVNRTFRIDGETYYLFPTAADVAALDLKTLRALQFSGRKAEYLLDLARMVNRGDLNLENLAGVEYGTAREILLSIRGIGPWSADYILMRGAGHRDAFPLGDSGINSAVKRLYGLPEKPEIDFLTALSDKWRPYRALAAFYLWKSL